LFGQWLAGQLAMARELAYFYAPGVNSYKRYQSGSFAPTRIVAGWDNRTCGFRLCGEGGGFRVENRIPGADAKPYLAFAATIAAGLHGIASHLKPPKPYEGNAYEDATLPQVPKTLREAIAELERSKVARTAFGDRVVDHYLHAARLEQQAFDQVVTGSGTAAVEAAVCSALPADGGLLVVDNGVYGDRLLRIARAHGIPTRALSYDVTTAARPDDVRAALRAEPQLTHVAVVHHET